MKKIKTYNSSGLPIFTLDELSDGQKIMYQSTISSLMGTLNVDEYNQLKWHFLLVYFPFARL